MKGKIKESRLVYKSEWLEVYDDFISVNKRPEIQQRKKESDNHSVFPGESVVQFFEALCYLHKHLGNRLLLK